MTKDPFILIVSGWRGATADAHLQFIAAKLRPIDAEWHERGVVLRHGKCPHGGVDFLADGIGRRWGWMVEEFPAAIRGGRVAGPARNRRMCAETPKAHLLMAFPGPGSRGTWDCIKWAAAYGIPFRGHPLEASRALVD